MLCSGAADKDICAKVEQDVSVCVEYVRASVRRSDLRCVDGSGVCVGTSRLRTTRAKVSPWGVPSCTSMDVCARTVAVLFSETTRTRGPESATSTSSKEHVYCRCSAVEVKIVDLYMKFANKTVRPGSRPSGGRK